MLLALSVALFALVHLIPAFPALKARVKTALGKAYGPAFGIASVLSLVLIVLAWQGADRSPVYEPPQWGFRANLILSFVAFLLVGIFAFRGRLRQVLRLPLAMAVIMWSTGHLLANGDVASVILFGGLLAYGAVHLLGGLASGFRPSVDVRQGHDLLSLLAGIALYGVMIQLHAHLIGVALFSIDDMSIFAR
jgi:uncharacterized membrane protein